MSDQMDVISTALATLVVGAFAWVLIVDVARALRSGVATFRIGRWNRSWENPIRKLASPGAFWFALIWHALWAIGLSIVFLVCAITMTLRLL
jgi:hypothetical protein